MSTVPIPYSFFYDLNFQKEHRGEISYIVRYGEESSYQKTMGQISLHYYLEIYYKSMA